MLFLSYFDVEIGLHNWLTNTVKMAICRYIGFNFLPTVDSFEVGFEMGKLLENKQTN